jgi:hypothetical protein
MYVPRTCLVTVFKLSKVTERQHGNKMLCTYVPKKKVQEHRIYLQKFFQGDRAFRLVGFTSLTLGSKAHISKRFPNIPSGQRCVKYSVLVRA